MSSDAHHHAGEHEHGAGHGSFKGYLIGFLLSVVLTAIPFWLVMSGTLGNAQATAIIITVLAAAQVVVHMVFFLHMDTKAEGGWTMMALIFTLIVVGITLAGSLWVMFHLTTNMMPTHDMGTMR